MVRQGDLVLPNGEKYKYWEDQTQYSKIIYVDGNSKSASDKNDGSEKHPYKTIGKAAEVAEPGCKVLIHGGTYREFVQPHKGGLNEKNMISYEAFPGEEVWIKGSIEVKDFYESNDWNIIPTYLNTKKKSLFYTDEENKKEYTIWEIRLNPDDFKGYNPFTAVNIIHDRLFIEYEKTDMISYLNRRGMVFVDGMPLCQVASYYEMDKKDGTYWVEENGLKIHFRMKNDDDPKTHCIEITNKEQCFSPLKPYLSYIHMKGIFCAQAANGGPVPQKGLISCNRGHHWIIENCRVDWANTVAIDCGNECWNHPIHKGQILGHTILRNNYIYGAGVCGIASIGAPGLLIEYNEIVGTGWQRMELSWEAAGIKLHNAVDTLICNNIVRECEGCDSLWLDLQNKNTRITQNVFINGIYSREHIFIECSRDGVNLIDHNVIWNVEGRFLKENLIKESGSKGWYKTEESNISNGYGIYLEGTDRLVVEDNLIGLCENSGFYAKPVSFRMSSNRGGTAMKNKVVRNIFYKCKEAAIKFPTVHNKAQENIFIGEPAGYLRILYPEPELCLDLDAWQEFLGFDLEGKEVDIELVLDTTKLILKVVNSSNQPKGVMKILGVSLENEEILCVNPRSEKFLCKEKCVK